MSIFGDLDIDEIPDNPFWVAEGDYVAIVTAAFFQKNKTNDKDQLIIEYTISDEDSEFDNKKVREYMDYYPDITTKDLENMPGKDRARVKRALSNLKRRLAGLPKHNKKGLGVPLSDLTPDWDPKSLINTEVNMGVINSGDDNEYSNVKWVELLVKEEA